MLDQLFKARMTARVSAGAVAALLGLAPASGAQSDPPTTTARESRPPGSIDEITRQAKPLPIPTREGAEPPRGGARSGPERRIDGVQPSSSTRGGGPSALAVCLAVAGVLAAGCAMWRVLRRRSGQRRRARVHPPAHHRVPGSR